MLKNMKREDLELLSYTKIAELYLKENKKTMNTADLFKEICNCLGLSEIDYQEKIADFFQSLTTSKDFILLNNGEWDLKANHSVKVDINDIYDEADETIEEEENEDDIENEYEDEEDMYDTPVDDDYDNDLSDLTILNEDEIEEE